MPTKIEWTDETWNPVTGCTPCSPGCDNCYARAMQRRFKKDMKVTSHYDRLTRPFEHRTAKRIFTCSMGDLFHHDVEDDFIASVFLNMAACAEEAEVRRLNGRPVLTFQILTKRPARALHFFWNYKFLNGKTLADKPLSNVWMGVTAEDQEHAEKRIRTLLDIPVNPHGKRFVSCEPLLGPIGTPMLGQVDWVIVGGENGPGARRMDEEWAIALREQARYYKIPFFYKGPGGGVKTSMLNGETCEEFPA